MLYINDEIDDSYLQRILEFLPMEPDSDGKLGDYIAKLVNVVAINQQNEQYQFAYLGVHLLFMTYLYCSAWKISQIESERYKDAIIFARAYNGRDLKIEEGGEIFNYSLIPEKEIAKLFKMINLDPSQIKAIHSLVTIRDELAHASGEFEILRRDSFDVKVESVISSMSAIHKCLEVLIKKWYEKEILKFSRGEYEDYDIPRDFISEYMIQTFNLSAKELIICNTMSINKILKSNPDCKEKLKKFKKAIADYCQEKNLVEI